MHVEESSGQEGIGIIQIVGEESDPEHILENDDDGAQDVPPEENAARDEEQHTIIDETATVLYDAMQSDCITHDAPEPPALV